MSTMNTFTGKRFDPMHIRPDDIDERDIAHALSLVCRGCGHLRRFYSVAQHSVNCAREALARQLSERIALACLLHDASEAYIADIIRPIKERLPDYARIETMIMDAVFAHFGLFDLSEEETRLWKRIDDDLLDNELKALLPGEEERIPVGLFSKPELGEKPFAETEREFLTLFSELNGSSQN